MIVSMVRIFLANTDNAWFDFLSMERDVTEANFWWPGETAVRAIGPGELLAFRLKSPRNKIGGFGVFSSHSLLPLQIAWETFGRANGRRRLKRCGPQSQHCEQTMSRCHRRISAARCLVEPVFFPRAPLARLATLLVTERYPTRKAVRHFRCRWLGSLESPSRNCASMFAPVIAGFAEAGARYGNPTLVKPRLGQGAFRVAVIEAYGRQCAVSDGEGAACLGRRSYRAVWRRRPSFEIEWHSHAQGYSFGIRCRLHNDRLRSIAFASVPKSKKSSTMAKSTVVFTASSEAAKAKGRLAGSKPAALAQRKALLGLTVVAPYHLRQPR